MEKSVVIPRSTEKFRGDIREKLDGSWDKFWANMEMLKPKDYVDAFLKVLPYAYSKVPEEKALDEDGKKKLILEETRRTATIIGGGLPEDAEFETED